MPAVKNAPARKSFTLEKPPSPEPQKLKLLQSGIHRNIKKEKLEEIQRKKREEEERIKREQAKEVMNVEVVAEEMKKVIEPQMDPEEQLKALEKHLEELNEQKHKLFLLLKQILNEDEKRKQAQEAEKRKQQEQQRAAELAQFPNGRPEMESRSPIISGQRDISQAPKVQVPSQPHQSGQMVSPRSSSDQRKPMPLSPSHSSHQQRPFYPPPVMGMPTFFPTPPVPPPTREPSMVLPQFYGAMPSYVQQMQMQQVKPYWGVGDWNQMGLLGHNPFNQARSGMAPSQSRPSQEGRGSYTPSDNRGSDSRGPRQNWRPN